MSPLPMGGAVASVQAGISLALAGSCKDIRYGLRVIFIKVSLLPLQCLDILCHELAKPVQTRIIFMAIIS